MSFNSRTREGCDIDRRGAGMYKGEFQFTHPGGVRRMSAFLCTTTRGFQFTHPGGVRPSSCAIAGRASRFNSRTREGCDAP